MAISTIGSDGLATSAVTSTKLSSGVPTRAQLPAGTVLQVVQGTYATGAQTSSTSFVDIGLTATITPTSATSKILVMSSLCGMYSGSAGTYAFQRYLRDATQVVLFDNIAGYVTNGAGGSNVSFCYLDSPATTSATTYKQQIKLSGGSTLYWNNATGGVNPTSTITLMEIAA